MRLLRGWRLPVLLLILFLLVAGAYAAWQAYQVSRDLSAAAGDARTLQGAVERGDDAAADAALERLRENSGAAAARTDGPTWTAMTYLPVVGDDLEGVAVVSRVLSDLSDDGLGPLASTAESLQRLTPRDGRVPIDVVRELQDPVRDGHRAFADAKARLDSQDPGGFVEIVGTRYRELAEQVDRAERVLGDADVALRSMPEMLGSDGEQNYLLIFQNNAEIRAGGGLPGAVSLITADDGEITMSRQVAANTFGRTDEPVLPLTDAEQEIWATQIGTFFLDANFTPDFPRSADLWKARWEQEYEPIDGVIVLDPVTLGYLLEATGPIEAPGGIRLTSENVVDELLSETYLRLERPADQDEFFNEVARRVFDRFTTGGGNPRGVIEAMARATTEGRLKLHVYDDEVQASIDGTRIAGEYSADPASPRPQVGVYLNDATGAKMSYYLRHDVEVTPTSCVDATQRFSARAFLLSEAPDDAATLPRYITGGGSFGVEPGGQRVQVHIVGPVGGEITDVRFNDMDLPVNDPVDLGGRPVVTALLLLEPGFTADLEWRMTAPRGQTGDIDVDVTAGVEPESKSRTVASAC